MRYKQSQSKNGVLIFVVGAFVVIFAFMLLVSLNADAFDRWMNIAGDGFYTLAVMLLSAAVVMGIVLAIGHLTGNRPVFGVGIVHGIIAIVGVISLLVSMQRIPRGTNIQISAILFAVTIGLGIVFFIYRRVKKSLPNVLVVLHALLALVGYVFLLRG